MLSEFFNGKELNTTVNPETAVVFGASVQAALLSDTFTSRSKETHPIAVDVVPFSIGLEHAGGVMAKNI